MSSILAHRGFCKKFPENTMLAFKEAAKFPIAGFETDVQRTKDGVLVLTHDEEISRLSDHEGLVMDYDLAELKKMDFRAGMTQYALDEETRIPTLEELLQYLKGNDLIVNIELKSSQIHYEGMVSETLKLVQDYDLIDRVIISSFNHKDVLQAKKICPEVKCGFLTWSTLIDPAGYSKKYGMDYYHPDYNTMEDVDWSDCLEAGIPVNPYTIDKVEDIKKMIDFKAKYIITNDVETACQVLADYQG